MAVQGPSCGMHFMLSGALQRFAQQILVFAVTRPRRPFPSLLSLCFSMHMCTSRPEEEEGLFIFCQCALVCTCSNSAFIFSVWFRPVFVGGASLCSKIACHARCRRRWCKDCLQEVDAKLGGKAFVECLSSYHMLCSTFPPCFCFQNRRTEPGLFPKPMSRHSGGGNG